MDSCVIVNGKVYLERERFAQAVCIEDGIIKAVGTNEECRAAAPAGAREYDAQGRTVVPGFNDSHMHLYFVGENLESIDVHGCTSMAEVKKIARDFIARTQPPKGTFLHGLGWNQDYFTDEARMMDRHDLDEITTEYPLVLERACGHAVTANSLAIEMAGITKDTPQPEGAHFDVDENGEPTGIFRETAANMVMALRHEPTVEEIEHTLRTAMAHAAQWGITSVQTMDVRPGGWRETLQAYENIQSSHPTLRVYHQCNFMDPASYQAFLDEGHKTGAGDSYNKIGPLKLFVDGSLGARTATMREPYADDPSTQGIQTLTQEQTDAMVKLADENGCQVAVHAIGDAAIEQVLNSYDTVCDGKNPHRHGVVHCQITDAPLVERFCENDILAYIQPIFLHYDMTVLESRVGKELASTSYAFHTMNKLGIHTSFGTDSPVEDLNTMNNLYCAVARKNLDKKPEGGFYPHECMDIYEAVDGYTAGSAYASFEEGVKGRIKPGYYGDLAILSQDIFTIPTDELLTTVVDATVLGGEFVYER